MSDFIILIKSNGDGDPVKGGAHGHWVVVTDDQNPVAVNQLSAGGAFPHADCGEACVKSVLASRGKPEPIVTIEHDASAGSAGTSTAGLVKALADFGIKSTVSKGYPAKNTPPFRKIMNPLGGRVETGQQTAYEAAYDGTTIALADAPKPPAPKPAPAPAPVADGAVRLVPARFVVVPRHPGGLPIHTGPNSADRTKAIEPNGTQVHCDAWTYGNAQVDPTTKTEDARWYRIYNNGGWIASAFVSGDAPHSTPTPAAPAPKPAVVASKPVVVAPTAPKAVVVDASKPDVPVVVTVKPAEAVPAPLPFIDGGSNSFITESAAASQPVFPEVLPKPDIPENA
jgi:hypothetical protein